MRNYITAPIVWTGTTSAQLKDLRARNASTNPPPPQRYYVRRIVCAWHRYIRCRAQCEYQQLTIALYNTGTVRSYLISCGSADHASIQAKSSPYRWSHHFSYSVFKCLQYANNIFTYASSLRMTLAPPADKTPVELYECEIITSKYFSTRAAGHAR